VCSQKLGGASRPSEARRLSCPHALRSRSRPLRLQQSEKCVGQIGACQRQSKPHKMACCVWVCGSSLACVTRHARVLAFAAAALTVARATLTTARRSKARASRAASHGRWRARQALAWSRRARKADISTSFAADAALCSCMFISVDLRMVCNRTTSCSFSCNSVLNFFSCCNVREKERSRADGGVVRWWTTETTRTV
jgi:hypothetical protein